MKTIISGASGFLGSALVELLRDDGHEVMRLVRRATGKNDEVSWDPAAGKLDPADLAGADAVVHLAGESLASGRWTAEKKRRIEASRVAGTRLLAGALAALDEPPRVLVSASAIGFYGDRGDEWLDEASSPGEDFLSEVCGKWEAAAEAARVAGIRVVHPRIGMVVDPAGGALAKMLTPFRLGLGGVVGDGRQWVSWITRHDLVRVLRHALLRDDLEGPLNAVAPAPVRNVELTKALGQALGRPTFLPVPAFGVRLAFGEMADELLLASTRVASRRLVDSGFDFRHPELAAAFRELLS